MYVHAKAVLKGGTSGQSEEDWKKEDSLIPTQWGKDVMVRLAFLKG